MRPGGLPVGEGSSGSLWGSQCLSEGESSSLCPSSKILLKRKLQESRCSGDGTKAGEQTHPRGEADSPPGGLPCGLSSRGSFLSRSFCSSTCSIFSITWRAGHRGRASLGAAHFLSGAGPWQAGPPGTCLLLTPHGLLQGLHLLLLVLVPPQQRSLWLLSLAQEEQLLLSVILLTVGEGGESGGEGAPGHHPWPRGSTPGPSAECPLSRPPSLCASLPSAPGHSFPGLLPLAPRSLCPQLTRINSFCKCCTSSLNFFMPRSLSSGFRLMGTGG